MSTTPRVKRPFAGAASDPSQRQITSFFNARDPATPVAEPTRAPRLPPSVEANLLSVGMRVRKSVPEGYKTSTHSAFKLWTDNTPLPSGPAKSPSSSAGTRELLPFCGINKTGGLAFQPAGANNDEDDDDNVPSVDDVPGLTLSQESVETNADEDDESPNVRKRFYDDDADVSPRTLAPATGSNARVIAVPRSRVLKRAAVPAVRAPAADQENMTVDNDFEDADFLVFGDGMDTA